MARDRARHVNPVAHWATMILAAAIIALGVIIGAGGVWLLTLGGSWYYAIAGLGLVATGVLHDATQPAAGCRLACQHRQARPRCVAFPATAPPARACAT